MTLPGVGSYIALAIQQRDLAAIGWAIGTMLVVILIYDQLLFRPLVAWADRFRLEVETGAVPPRSWVLTTLHRSRLVEMAMAPWESFLQWSLRVAPRPRDTNPVAGGAARSWDRILDLVLLGIALLAAWQVGLYVSTLVPVSEVGRAGLLGLLTMARVFVLIALASLVWVPVGVWIGLRPDVARVAQPVAQFLAAFPANLFFPLVVSSIVALQLNPNVWLSPLMILGTQWYILFNVIAGATLLPGELRDVSTNFGIGGWLWWRKVALPGVFPFYLTGAITASGGSWNAAIVSEVASWGHDRLQAQGLGAYIADATLAGDYPRIVLGIVVMSLFVVIINRGFWRPLHRYAERRFRLA